MSKASNLAGFVPSNVVTYRAAVVSVSEQRETLISSVTTVQELQNLNLPDWPTL
jgi:hypothetical protein